MSKLIFIYFFTYENVGGSLIFRGTFYIENIKNPSDVDTVCVLKIFINKNNFCNNTISDFILDIQVD
jgi:hypothetical protein